MTRKWPWGSQVTQVYSSFQYIFGHFFDKNYVLTLNAPHVKTKCRNKNASETFAGRIEQDFRKSVLVRKSFFQLL